MNGFLGKAKTGQIWAHFYPNLLEKYKFSEKFQKDLRDIIKTKLNVKF